MKHVALIASVILAVVFAGGIVPASAAANGRPTVTSVSPAAGPAGGGTTLTIHGTQFSHVEAVTVGGKNARGIHVRSSTVLTVVTPPHAVGGAAIVVTEKAGTSPPSPVRFHYVNKPRLAGLSAHSGPVTGGQVIAIYGSNFSYVTAVMFGALQATVLPHSTTTRLLVKTPASWAATVDVIVRTLGGATVSSGKTDLFVFQNPAPTAAGQVTPATGDVVASNVTAVSGGPDFGAPSAPWTVTLPASAKMPAMGQQFLLKPGGKVYPGGLAGTVTAADTTARTITVTPGSLDAAVRSAKAVFTGPLSGANAASRVATASASSLTGEIDFGSISASELACDGLDGKSVSVTGSFSLTLTNVEAHVELDAGSLWTRPYVDVWISYQPTIAFSLKAEDEAKCSLPPAWQNTHEKLFLLGDSGATIAIAPDASFSVSVAGTVSFSQHSYRILGFVSNPDGSISKLDGKSSDPATVHVSAELKAEAYGGVQIQVGELNVIGVGMSIGGGMAGTATSDWPPQVCLSAYPYLRGTLYAYLNLWVKEWKLQGFQVELDFNGISTCTGDGWHVAWQSTTVYALDLSCPTAAECFMAGRTPKYGYILRTQNGGQTWTAATLTAFPGLWRIACADTSHCVAGWWGTAKVAVTSNAGASWSLVSLPQPAYAVAGVGSIACVPAATGGICYLTAYLKKYSGQVVYTSANGGRAWTPGDIVSNEPTAMACLSSTSCLAVGETPYSSGLVAPAASQATRDGWGSYVNGTFPASWYSLTSVACMSLSRCYAAGFDQTGNGYDMLTTTNFGKSWTKVPVPVLPWAVSCPGTSTCVVGGSGPNWSQYVATTYDGGHSWVKTTISQFPASDDMNTYTLNCPSLGHCVAIEYGGGPSAIVVS
jgi:hypothetical protein